MKIYYAVDRNGNKVISLTPLKRGDSIWLDQDLKRASMTSLYLDDKIIEECFPKVCWLDEPIQLELFSKPSINDNFLITCEVEDINNFIISNLYKDVDHKDRENTRYLFIKNRNVSMFVYNDLIENSFNIYFKVEYVKYNEKYNYIVETREFTNSDEAIDFYNNVDK